MTTVAQPFFSTGYGSSVNSYTATGAESPEGMLNSVLDVFAYSSSPRPLSGLDWFHGVAGTSSNATSRFAVANSTVTPLITSAEVPSALAEIRGQLGLNTTALAELIGVARQAIYDWMKGGTVKEGNRFKVASLLGIADEWHALGRGPMGPEAHELGEYSDLLALLKADRLDRTSISATLVAIRDVIVSREANALPSARDLVAQYGLPESSREDYRRKVKAAARRAKRGL